MKKPVILSVLLIMAGVVFAQDAGTGSYEFGDTGPGGGMVFFRYGDTYLECSDNLEKAKWTAQDYQDGGYDDWYLPSKEELNYIYENLVVKGFIEASGWYWTSSWSYGSNYWSQTFSDGTQYSDYRSSDAQSTQNSYEIRAVRSFTPVVKNITYWLMDPYRTTDNLRIRKKEGLAGNALFTLPKNTFVKITELGNKETIDGITANWVQVEVQKDTLSIQGDTIKAGTLGWCFGGYLAMYKIGDTGPGGGMVFYIGADNYLECSDDLGEVVGGDTYTRRSNGGGYSDWYLPDSNELNYIYENLVENGFIESSGVYWCSSDDYETYWYQNFSNGDHGLSNIEDEVSYNVRNIRSFFP